MSQKRFFEPDGRIHPPELYRFDGECEGRDPVLSTQDVILKSVPGKNWGTCLMCRLRFFDPSRRVFCSVGCMVAWGVARRRLGMSLTEANQARKAVSKL